MSYRAARLTPVRHNPLIDRPRGRRAHRQAPAGPLGRAAFALGFLVGRLQRALVTGDPPWIAWAAFTLVLTVVALAALWLVLQAPSG